MHICIASPTFRPRVGGLETHVATLADSLASIGHQVTVLTNRDHPTHPPVSEERGVRILRIGSLTADLSNPDKVPWEEAMFGLLRDVDRYLGQEKFDVIHTHSQAALLLVSLTGMSASTPVVASPHETEPQTAACGDARSRFVYGAAAPDIVLAGSRKFADQVVALGVPEARVRVVLHGLPASTAVQDRSIARKLLYEQFGLDSTGTLITLVGRYVLRKRQLRLLDAIRHMESAADCRFLLVGSCNSGDREYLETIRRRAATDQRAGQIHVLEDCTDETRDLIWAATDVATQPSSHEGLGLACIEAMRAAAPVVASDIPGLREVVDDACGLLVDTSDPTAYASALDWLAFDPQLRHRLGHAGEQRASQIFNAELAATATLRIYHEAGTLRRASSRSR